MGIDVTRTTALVASISLLLLGGAWYLSRALTADVRPVTPVNSSVMEPAPLPAPLTVVKPPPPALTAPVPPPVPLAAAPPPEPPRPPEEALSPEALELKGIADQAAAQLADLKGGPANWRRAEKLYARCLFLDSSDSRCLAGLEAARRRLGPKAPKPTARPPDWEE